MMRVRFFRSLEGSPSGVRDSMSVISLIGLIGFLGCGGPSANPDDFAAVAAVGEPTDAPCAHREERRQAFFGDLHVHSALSSDAWNYDLEVRPDGAYRYAFGGPIMLPPKDSAGRGTREVRIDRPLDFMAVTDHAEFFGEQILCTDPDSPVYDVSGCEGLRNSTAPSNSPLALKIISPFSSRDAEICGEDGARCLEKLQDGWTETIEAAEKWDDRTSACERTTFIGYEYSSFRLGSNLHRNVIFRGSDVLGRPASYIDFKREWELWSLLKEQCNESATECEAIAIPHNSNISNGRMFSIDYPGAGSVEEQAARATLRMEIEPIVEVMQHKGDSECRRGLSSVLGADDALCDFEKFENAAFRNSSSDGVGECYDGPFADSVPHMGPSCLSRRSYVRYALADGLAEEERIGVNPFKFGLMASTDTHNATGGSVEEKTWPGHLGVADGAKGNRLSVASEVPMGNYSNGPGGLIGVWAEENSREAIFDAMRRKEVFGTSGPRIEPRFYAGWDLPADLCDGADVLGAAEAAGVPMGADLPERGSGAKGSGPVFAAWAAKDPGTVHAPGGQLQRIQIIKGWVDDEGAVHQDIFDLAGGDNGASVDPLTCEVSGPGRASLCGVWRDPDFDPDRRAVYYARVVENPSCRWSTWQCNTLPPSDRPSGCNDDLMQKVQQERAWTSPIWYTPAAR